MERIVFPIVALTCLSLGLALAAACIFDDKETFGVAPMDVMGYVLAVGSFVCGATVIVRLIMYAFS